MAGTKPGHDGDGLLRTSVGIVALSRGCPNASDGRVKIAPCRLAGRELLPEITDKLGDLIVAHMVPEAWHVAEVARGGLGDAVQNHLDQVVGRVTVQIAVQRKRWPAAE